MTNDWWQRNSVPPVPKQYREEREALASSIRDWHPDYNVGDYVVIRPGTLGNMDGKDSSRKVAGFFWRGSHLCVLLEWPYDTLRHSVTVYTKVKY